VPSARIVARLVAAALAMQPERDRVAEGTTVSSADAGLRALRAERPQVPPPSLASAAIVKPSGRGSRSLALFQLK
jgi:hypothetical protein